MEVCIRAVIQQAHTHTHTHTIVYLYIFSFISLFVNQVVCVRGVTVEYVEKLFGRNILSLITGSICQVIRQKGKNTFCNYFIGRWAACRDCRKYSGYI
jgi:hypothetical protein